MSPAQTVPAEANAPESVVRIKQAPQLVLLAVEHELAGMAEAVANHEARAAESTRLVALRSL